MQFGREVARQNGQTHRRGFSWGTGATGTKTLSGAHRGHLANDAATLPLPKCDVR
jgi:hypothetical protein